MGELKERITKAYSQYYRGKGNFGSKVTDAIIDEAKREFPIRAYYEKNKFEAMTDILKWFEKWFSE